MTYTPSHAQIPSKTHSPIHIPITTQTTINQKINELGLQTHIPEMNETIENRGNNTENISKNKTTFIISHRVSSAKNADKIIILDAGEITQQGTHNQLITQEGYYKELYEQQLLEKEF